MTRHTRKGRSARLSRAQASDLLAVLALVIVGLLLLAYATALPPAPVRFALDQAPDNVTLRGLYGIEQNAGGPFRWTKPDATLAIPVAAPGVYRVTLTLADSPVAPPQRPMTILVNGAAAGTFTLATAPRDYSVQYTLGARDWAGAGQQALQVQLRTPAFVPNGDPRALGAIITRAGVEPAAPERPDWLALLPSLLLLAGAYAALRYTGLRLRDAALVVGLVLAGYAVLAIWRRPAALVLAYQPVARPVWFLVVVLELAALPLLWRAVARARPATAGPEIDRFWSRQTWPLTPVALLALALRGYDYTRLSLWLDEGATVHFARKSWAVVLGLSGAYDLHPPLYYALTKLAAVALPLADAGRMVSVIAGTLTVVVVYALGVRLAGRGAGFLAALILAVSPMHIWHSQDARMYALTALLTGCSYLALVAYEQTADQPGRERFWWALAYCVATLLALYADYSAVYALVPQVALWVFIGWRHRRQAFALGLALVGVIVGYLPWLPQLLASVGQITGDQSTTQLRNDYLAATPGRVGDSLLSIVGLGGEIGAYAGSLPRAWEQWPAWHIPLVLVFGLAGVLGAVALARRGAAGPLAVAGLLGGAVVIAVLVSQASSGYADRTILAATLGWALLAGAGGAVLGGRGVAWLRAGSVAGIAVTVVVALVSLAAVWRGPAKPDYRGLVADVATVTSLGQPVFPVSDWLPDFIAAYQPQLAELTMVDSNAPINPGNAPGAWLAYVDDPWQPAHDAARKQLSALGYQRVLHKYYAGQLYLDYYLRPDVQIGAAMPFNGDFAPPGAGTASAAQGWQLPPDGVQLAPDQTGGRYLRLQNAGNGDQQAVFNAPITPGTPQLFVLDYTVQAPLVTGDFGVALTCIAANGARLDLPATEGAASVPHDGAWHAARTAALCPPNTATLRIALQNSGNGDVAFQQLRLWRAELAQPGR
ncbi:MAG: glycosyltransferase family 39 protein [Thermomicrobiales bacterium]